MDIATVVGLIGTFGLLVGVAGSAGGIGVFLDMPSLLIVFGGTLTTMMIRFSPPQLIATVPIVLRAIIVVPNRTDEIIAQLIDMANVARRDGILALEKVKSPNRFLQSAINHCVDGADPEFLEGILRKDLVFLQQRHQQGMAVLEGIGDIAPAFGMIGSIFGLMPMLNNLGDPAAVTSGMSAAILSTLYGAVIANVVVLPLAGKLDYYSNAEQLTRHVIIDGMIGIQKGTNPRLLQEALKTALPPKVRDAME